MHARLWRNTITLYTEVAPFFAVSDRKTPRLPRGRTLSFLSEIVDECPAIALPSVNVQRPTQTSQTWDDMVLRT